MNAQLFNYVAAACATIASAASFAAWLRSRAVAPGVGVEATSADHDTSRATGWRRLVAPIAVRLAPSSTDELQALETRLQMAGRRARSAVDRFNEERVVALVLGVVLALGIAIVGHSFAALMLALGSLLLGIVGPAKLLDIQATTRREAIAVALPSTIDLLMTCIDAGLSLEHALVRVAREITGPAPTLATELDVTARELEAGVPLADALRRLSRRVGLDDLSALCGVLAQAHGLGAPIGNTLREFAASSRRQQMGQLEERAGKLAAQMTLPLALFLLPAAMLIIIGPAALQLVRALH